jgi:ribosomal protein L40E
MSEREIMPHRLERRKGIIVCEYCGAEVPNDAEKCPKCGLSNSIIRTTTCDFCGSAIPLNAKTCPKCHREQVEAIIGDRKSAGTYDGDEEPLPLKISLKDSIKFCSKIVVIALVIAIPFGLIHEAMVPMALGLGLIFFAAIVGGGYIPPFPGMSIGRSKSSADPSWAVIGGAGLLLIFFGAIFYKIL